MRVLWCGRPETLLLVIAPTVIFAVTFGVLLLFQSGERLIVCERGLLVGSIAPDLRPYIIAYRRISPGSIAGVTGADRCAEEAGLNRRLSQSTLRASWWTKNGGHFVARSAEDARRGRRRLTLAFDPLPRSIHGRWTWFAGTGRTSPVRAIEDIAQAPRNLLPSTEDLELEAASPCSGRRTGSSPTSSGSGVAGSCGTPSCDRSLAAAISVLDGEHRDGGVEEQPLTDRSDEHLADTGPTTHPDDEAGDLGAFLEFVEDRLGGIPVTAAHAVDDGVVDSALVEDGSVER